MSVFGVEGTGNKFVYVFDRSSSMEGAPLAAAKRQLIESLNSLDTRAPVPHHFLQSPAAVFDITSGGRRIAFASERNKQLAANFVGGITADGGTDRFTALKQALAFRPDVIFFLTDADDPMSTSELADLEQDLLAAGHGHLRDRIRPHANSAAEKFPHRVSRAKRRAIWLRQHGEAKVAVSGHKTPSWHDVRRSILRLIVAIGAQSSPFQQLPPTRQNQLPLE